MKIFFKLGKFVTVLTLISLLPTESTYLKVLCADGAL